MNKLIKSIASFSLLAAATSANAVIIDFTQMAEPSGSHGESIWSTLTITNPEFNLDIKGTKDGQAAYAYLDAGNAGLGVCGVAKDLTKLNKITNSGTNLCNPGSDDNMTFNENLSLIFSQDVVIDTIWLNNNHDQDASLLGDTVNIGGSALTFTNGGYKVDSYTSNPYYVNAGEIFDISFNNEQFYLSAMDVRKVPAPGVAALMGIGLIGLVATRRRIAK